STPRLARLVVLLLLPPVALPLETAAPLASKGAPPVRPARLLSGDVLHHGARVGAAGDAVGVRLAQGLSARRGEEGRRRVESVGRERDHLPARAGGAARGASAHAGGLPRRPRRGAAQGGCDAAADRSPPHPRRALHREHALARRHRCGRRGRASPRGLARPPRAAPQARRQAALPPARGARARGVRAGGARHAGARATAQEGELRPPDKRRQRGGRERGAPQGGPRRAQGRRGLTRAFSVLAGEKRRVGASPAPVDLLSLGTRQ
ncbi:hypothetical protein EMIHUDRAFT_453027, partial [Emiliania huxleyi CCMP1516]|uniref:Uncharacterized protein n=2 Tax=Emiliania huxleyi TaxID=2903 RepID=A0A0D3IBD2_EMIH1